MVDHASRRKVIMQGETSQDNSLPHRQTIVVFSVLAGILLLVTGAAKIFSSFGHSEILVTTDPIFGFTFRRLMILAGLLEIMVAICCFYPKNRVMSMTFVAWLSSLLLLYRVGLKLIGWRHPCPCAGYVTDALNISPGKADFIMKMILAYLLFVSYGSLFLFARQKWRRRLVLPSSEASSDAMSV